MSVDCGVCIGGDYDWDCGPEFYNVKQVLGRKSHRCCECKREIQKGEPHERVAGKWDGDLLTYRTCTDCVAIREKFSCGGGFLFESLWSDMENYAFDHLTTGCFEGLPAAAKQFLVDRWNQWKFRKAS